MTEYFIMDDRHALIDASKLEWENFMRYKKPLARETVRFMKVITVFTGQPDPERTFKTTVYNNRNLTIYRAYCGDYLTAMRSHREAKDWILGGCSEN